MRLGDLLSLARLPVDESALVRHVEHVHAVRHDGAVGQSRLVLLDGPLGEAPVLGDHDLLTARELELRTTQRLDHVVLVLLSHAHRDQRLVDVHTSDGALRLAVGASHAGLQSIGAGTGQHLVDTDHVERVGAHSNVERVLAAGLHQVLVRADTRRLQGLRRDLLILARDQVHAQRKLLDASLLLAQIEDSNFRIRHTTTEARLDVRLVLAVAIAAGESVRWLVK